MKIKIFLVSCLTLLALIGCGWQKDLEFKGKSDNWEVVYEANIHGESSESKRVRMKYVGDEDPPENINYQIKSAAGGSSANGALIQNGVINASAGSCSGCAITSENEEIEVTIEWNGKSEKLTLTKES